MRYLVYPLFAASLLAAPAFAENHGHHDGGHDDGGHHDAMMTGMAGDAANAARTVSVTLVDNYFEPESLSVAPGETVRFVISNQGEVVHEFNIGTAATHAAHQEEMMMMVEHGAIEIDRINHDMMNMDMGDGETMSHDEPNSVLLAPGESAEIVWTFPEAGSLEFACNVPGHYDAGMMGDISIGK
jgi:uncharacterized cupredoxin-like copper-binding protein